MISSFQAYAGPPQPFPVADDPTPDTWNLERPACFEIVPTAARSGAADKSALPATTPLATPCLRTDCNRRAHARVQGDCAPSRIFIRGGARSDLLFTMSDNTHPAERTQPGAKTFASGRADDGAQEDRQLTTQDRREGPSASVVHLLSFVFCRPGRSSGLVEPDGIEPTTSCLQSRRSPN